MERIVNLVIFGHNWSYLVISKLQFFEICHSLCHTEVISFMDCCAILKKEISFKSRINYLWRLKKNLESFHSINQERGRDASNSQICSDCKREKNSKTTSCLLSSISCSTAAPRGSGWTRRCPGSSPTTPATTTSTFKSNLTKIIQIGRSLWQVCLKMLSRRTARLLPQKHVSLGCVTLH